MLKNTEYMAEILVEDKNLILSSGTHGMDVKFDYEKLTTGEPSNATFKFYNLSRSLRNQLSANSLNIELPAFLISKKTSYSNRHNFTFYLGKGEQLSKVFSGYILSASSTKSQETNITRIIVQEGLNEVSYAKFNFSTSKPIKRIHLINRIVAGLKRYNRNITLKTFDLDVKEKQAVLFPSGFTFCAEDSMDLLKKVCHNCRVYMEYNKIHIIQNKKKRKKAFDISTMVKRITVINAQTGLLNVPSASAKDDFVSVDVLYNNALQLNQEVLLESVNFPKANGVYFICGINVVGEIPCTSSIKNSLELIRL